MMECFSEKYQRQTVTNTTNSSSDKDFQLYDFSDREKRVVAREDKKGGGRIEGGWEIDEVYIQIKVSKHESLMIFSSIYSISISDAPNQNNDNNNKKYPLKLTH